MEFNKKLKEYQEVVNTELEKYVRKHDCYEKTIITCMLNSPFLVYTIYKKRKCILYISMLNAKQIPQVVL